MTLEALLNTMQELEDDADEHAHVIKAYNKELKKMNKTLRKKEELISELMGTIDMLRSDVMSVPRQERDNVH